jgi:hypothetical protein
LKKISLFIFLFFACLLKTEAFSLPSSDNQIESIKKIAESLRRSLNQTLGQRQKAVARGMESKFDTTFEEAHILLDSLFQEIHKFLELQNTNSHIVTKSKDVLAISSDELNKNALKKLAYFQTLMEHLQAAINELNPSDSPLKAQVLSHKSKRLSTSVAQKGRRHPRGFKTSRQKLNGDDEDRSRPYVKYQVSGTKILPPDPADESYIH